jgi:chromate transport protein ChrA
MSKSLNANRHKTLTRLIAANIILDIVAIVIWFSLPPNTWNGMYRLDSLTASIEAAIAAVLFTATLVGLKRRKKWAPKAAIAITITQRIFAIYVFFPSIAIPIPLIWSLVIIYFAIKDLKTSKFQS